LFSVVITLFAFALPAGANSDSTTLAVSAWPARLVVSAPGRATVRVANPSEEAVRLVARAAGYALDARGRPRIKSVPTRWFAVRPSRLVVGPHGFAQLRLTVSRPPGAGSGDHAELLLLSTEPRPGRRVSARLRLGVVVVVRVPGRLVHRLGVARLRVRRGGAGAKLEVTVANRGNVDEWLQRGRVSVMLVRRGRRIVSVPVEARRLLARSSGVFDARFRRRVRGQITAVVVVRHPRKGVTLARWRYRVSL
jgi:hypothetical protein